MNRFTSISRSLMHKSSSGLVKLHQLGTSRVIELNRPAQLNSLNLEMVEAMTEALKVYADSPTCSSVIIKGCEGEENGRKAFCAGGDVVSLIKAKHAGKTVEEVSEFFRKEYALNHLIGTFPKPIISLLDGVTSKIPIIVINTA